MNYKNLLQEYCQKYKHDIPLYTTILIGGSTHAPEWQSSVLVKNITIKNDTAYASKKEAEQSVAKIAYEQVANSKMRIGQKSTQILQLREPEQLKEEQLKEEQPIELKEQNKSEDRKVYIFIDLENIQPVFEQVPDNVHIHCFMSKFSSIDMDRYSNYHIHITDLNTKNAADYLLTLTVGSMLHSICKTDKIYIVSRDKDVANIQYILESWNYDIKHITKSIDIVRIVQNIIFELKK